MYICSILKELGLHNIRLWHRYGGTTTHNFSAAKGNDITIHCPGKYTVHMVALLAYIVAHVVAFFYTLEDSKCGNPIALKISSVIDLLLLPYKVPQSPN